MNKRRENSSSVSWLRVLIVSSLTCIGIFLASYLIPRWAGVNRPQELYALVSFFFPRSLILLLCASLYTFPKFSSWTMRFFLPPLLALVVPPSIAFLITMWVFFLPFPPLNYWGGLIVVEVSFYIAISAFLLKDLPFFHRPSMNS